MLSDSSKPIGGAVLLVVLLIVSAVLSSVYSNEKSSGPVHSVQAGVGMVAAPLQFVGVGVAYAEDAAGDAIQNATASDSSYTQLRDENAQLKAQLAELEEYRGEAQRLQGLLDLSDKYDFSGVTGRVIGKGTDAWNRVVTLNVGSASGVECGLPVVGGSGLVGQVIEVSPLTCRVRLISDPQSGVSVVLQSNRAEGVVRGSIAGLLYLEDLDTSTEVNVGDVVITSGLGGSYFRGVALGTVVNVINAAGRRIELLWWNRSAPPIRWRNLRSFFAWGPKATFRARAMLRLPMAVPPKAVRRHA